MPETVGYLSSGIIPAEAVNSDEDHYSAIRYCITLRNNILGFKDPSHLLLHYLQRLLTLDSCVVYI